MTPRGGRCLSDSLLRMLNFATTEELLNEQVQQSEMNRPDNSFDIEALTEVINRIKDRIKQDRHVGRNETRTRNALIDPLLNALGWDPQIPRS